MVKHMTLALVAASVLAAAVPVRADLIAHWKLDDGVADNTTTTAVDEVDAAQNGALTNMSTPDDRSDGSGWITSEANGAKVGGAIEFNGDTDNAYIAATVGSDLPTGNAARTVSLWVYTDATAKEKFFSYGGNGDGEVFDLTIEDTGGSPHIYFRHDGGNRQYPGAVLNEWMHVAVVVPDSATHTDDLQVFINGAEKIGFQGGGSVRTLNTAADDDELFLGARETGPAPPADYFAGRLDDVQIYDQALSDTQIQSLFDSPGSVIPEPATLGMMIVGGIGLAVMGRRRSLGMRPR